MVKRFFLSCISCLSLLKYKFLYVHFCGIFTLDVGYFPLQRDPAAAGRLLDIQILRLSIIQPAMGQREWSRTKAQRHKDKVKLVIVLPSKNGKLQKVVDTFMSYKWPCTATGKQGGFGKTAILNPSQNLRSIYPSFCPSNAKSYFCIERVISILVSKYRRIILI